MKFHTRFDVPATKGLNCKEKTRTQQHFKDECDINNILKKYQKTGQLPDMIRSNPQYGDFSEVADYQTSLDIVAKAHAQFEALSARVRERFANDPAKFLAFCSDPKNTKEMISLGLAFEKKADTIPNETKPEVKMKNKILLVLLKQLFEHVLVPMAREYVEKTDNNWDNKALDFLIELEKYVLTKLDSDK